jgi:hypothetical protein
MYYSTCIFALTISINVNFLREKWERWYLFLKTLFSVRR